MRVRRAQLNLFAATMEILDRGLVAQQGDDDIAFVGGGLGAYHHQVAVEDPGFNHAVALHLEHEQISVPK